ncbi:helix-turn-helix domain-containing protein [Aestuariimicrobium sp. p3-SID1156]|uniref:helix-turn-helix domain-containing protein n=1 Tax=Aestuariimicrobium sp. p3-SID1156 TaxID=2916038 RepID=UPI00223C336F|nr:helix-turn-helix domain-containing protein [Aestuariimicrobium sp. p3-SID1156]MCT1459907.1 helix-turn-helix domain-containing protein [Aestuariimicrobium sp. p3-SID1156]
MTRDDDLLSIATIAQRLDVSRDFVRKAINRGDLDAFRLGTQVRVTEAEFLRWRADLINQSRAS